MTHRDSIIHKTNTPLQPPIRKLSFNLVAHTDVCKNVQECAELTSMSHKKVYAWSRHPVTMVKKAKLGIRKQNAVIKARRKTAMSSKEISTRIEQAIKSSTISDISKQQYLRRQEVITQLSGQADIWTAIVKHSGTVAALQAKYGEKLSSIHVYATSVLTSFKHLPELKELAPESYKAWKEFNDAATGPLEHRAKTAKPTPRQEPGVIAFEEIIAKRESLPVGSDARLLLSVYSHLPPKRVDFARARIFYEKQRHDTPGNYLILHARGAGVSELVMNEFKTFKKYGQFREDLPAVLVTEIRASLKRRPREFLFVSTRDRQPYKSDDIFGAWANRMLKSLFGKPLTISLIRHSYLTYINFENMTPLDREDIARRMQHSVLQQINYRWILPKE